jgi:hypothetical protein
LGHLAGLRQPGLSDKLAERVKLSTYNRSYRKHLPGWNGKDLTVFTSMTVRHVKHSARVPEDVVFRTEQEPALEMVELAVADRRAENRARK